MSKDDDEEYRKLYTLLSSLSSKTAPRTEKIVTPVISLMTEKQTSITLTLDIPPLEPIVKASPTIVKALPTIVKAPLKEEIQPTERPLPIIKEEVKPPEPLPIKNVEISPLEEIMSKSSTRSGTTFTCEACFKVFPTYSNLMTHHRVTQMCAYWYTLPNKEEYEHNPSSIHIYMDELLAETVAEDGSPNQCRFCHSTFSNKGNLHKHFHTSIVCNRMAYARFKKVVANLK